MSSQICLPCHNGRLGQDSGERLTIGRAVHVLIQCEVHIGVSQSIGNVANVRARNQQLRRSEVTKRVEGNGLHRRTK